MRTAKISCLTARLHVQDEIDIALLVSQYILRAVACYRRESHGFEHARQRLRIWAGEFDEFETVGAERVLKQIF